jgi:hypothetical protein
MSVTVAALAAQLQIDETALREFGLSDNRFYGGSVKIPYNDTRGQEVTARFLTALDGADRFRFQRGAQITLYGLSRLAHESGDAITLVTNEFDAITIWYDGGDAAVALPGPTSWEEDRDAHRLARFAKIYVVVPASGSERTAVLDWLSRSNIKSRAFLINLPEQFADLASLYQDGPTFFAERYQRLLEEAVDYSAQAQIECRAERNLSQHLAARLLASENILDQVYQTARDELFVVDEERLVKVIYLVMTSRLFDKIVSLIVKGPSATGKSYTVQQVLKLFPAHARLEMTSMTDRALVYTEQSLQHRMLVLYEATGLTSGFMAYLVRTLLSEGRIRYMTRQQTIEQPGPTGLIVTTTELNLHPENETRCLMMTTDDSPAHTRAIMEMEARGRGRRMRALSSVATWHALQDFLTLGEHDVVIPYRHTLATLIPPVAVRLSRDFSTLLSLIETHALLHQGTRERNEEGAVIANLEDYAIIRELVGELISAEAGVGVPAVVRETRAAVASLLTTTGQAHLTIQQLARALHLDISTVHRRVNLAIRDGYLVNREERRGRPARLVLGDEVPGSINLLPLTEVLMRAVSRPPRLQRPTR